MSLYCYCDVALPVPLDRAFTYELGEFAPVVGARVMVPFGGQRLVGVVVRLHDVAPGGDVQVKRVERVLDEEALLSDDLMELGRWIASYYCAPLGDVLRGMVPVTAAEVRRQWVYRIGEQGRRVLYESARGASRRSKVSVETQNREYAVLNYLEIVEEWKWRGIPVWSHGGIVCTGEAYKKVVKMTFAKGAALKDPLGLFNSSMDGNVRRAIDLHEGEELD